MKSWVLKDKYWIQKDGIRWLFKESRVNTGEDWSEKIAAEIAILLQIPAAIVELAECEGTRGTLSLSFIDRDKGESLIHGNEILAGQVFSYDPTKHFGQLIIRLKIYARLYANFFLTNILVIAS